MSKKGNPKLNNVFSARVCGIKAGCLSHICQDAIAQHQFIDVNGEEVFLGAVSDGCSGAIGSEYGATFIVEAFIAEAERLGKNGNRDSNYLRNVALAISERLADYKPKLNNSELVSSHGITTCEEEVATLYGFVADSKSILLILAGDGMLSINDNCKSIVQQDGDVYPACLLRFPKHEWTTRIDDLYAFVELETNSVQNLIIATDGFGNPTPKEYPGLTKNPAMFILHARCHATEERPYGDFPGAYSFRGGDDTTALIFTRATCNTEKLLGHTDVEKIVSKVSLLGSNGFLRDRKKISTETLRHSTRQNGMPFDRNIAVTEDVNCLGITPQDEDEYRRRRNSIFASRVFASDFFGALFGTSNNKEAISSKQVPFFVTPKETQPSLIATIKQPLAQKDPPQIQKATRSQAPKIKTTTHLHTNDSRQGKFSFSDLCQPNHSKYHWIGFRNFGRVMYDLWHFVNSCHRQELRLGNLRPQDLSMEIIHDKKEVKYQFSLVNPDSVAMIDSDNELVRFYTNLDYNFVHPDYLPELGTNDLARLNQDWYAFSVLCYWFVTKYDPLGEGTLFGKQELERIYRMELDILNQAPEVDIAEWKRKFIRLALGRLSPEVTDFICAFMDRDAPPQAPDFLLAEFHKNKIVICKTIPPDDENKKRGRPKNMQCGFKQLPNKLCGYCEKPLSSSAD